MFNFRQLGTSSIRKFSSLRPPYKGKIPIGYFLAPLRSDGKVVFHHPLDNGPEHRRFLIEDLPFEVLDSVPHQFRTEVLELMQYNLPLFPPSWTFVSELIYMKAVPKENQTPDGYRKSRILRACFDCRYSGFAILDDIMDKSNKRQGKITWEFIAPKGQAGAISGGMLLNQIPYYLLTKHFRRLPTFRLMMDKMIESDFRGMIGGVMDVYGQGGSKGKTLDPALAITAHKAGALIGMQATLAMHNIGIVDPELEKLVFGFQTIYGEVLQGWDDFCDYYCTPIETGKPSRDFANGSTTWTSGTALKLFTEEQTRIFNENYGSTEPEKQETIRKLYDDINISEEYIKYLKVRSRDCHDLIQQMSHPGIRETFMSLLDWMFGDLYLK